MVNVTDEKRMRNQLTFVIANLKSGETIILRGKGGNIPKCARMLEIVTIRIEKL